MAKRQAKTLGLAAATALGAALVAWLLGSAPPLRSLELKTYDLRFVLRGRLPPPPGVMLVLIDEETEKALPEPMVLWHPHYAALFRALSQGKARAIGLDVTFAMSVSPWMPDADRELAAAFEEVSASVPIILGHETLQSAQEGLPLYLLARLHDAMGFANLTVDNDDFVRRQELETKDGQEKSFAARLAAAVNVPAPAADKFVMIHYWGPGGTFPSVSMTQVLEVAKKGDTAQLESWFRNQAVLIGSNTPPLDTHPTPFYQYPGQRWRNTNGVEIQATTLATLLEKRFLREVPQSGEIALVLGAAILAAALVFGVRFPWAPIALLAAVALYLGASVAALRIDWILPVVPPLLGAFLSGFASYAIYSLTEGRQRRLLQEVFGQSFPAEVVEELFASGEIPLGGVQQQVTVMFTDLRNYTNYSHGCAPQQVVQELNEYFGDMTAEIGKHGGMTDKFIGDGIMALFGAPIPHPDDALRAVRCALAMVRSNEEFNRRREAQGLKPLVIGVGLHSGEAVVGTIGAPRKMDYTAIGDTVNIASRIEGENKKFHSRLLVSEATYLQVRDRVNAELAGPADLKGIDEPVVLYKIIGMKSEEVAS